MKKLGIILLFLFFMLGCYGNSYMTAANDPMQVWFDTENIDPAFRRAFTNAGIDYYIYGSRDEFEKWWTWVHPENVLPDGITGRYFTSGGRREIWVIGKLTAEYKVRPNPTLWAEEHFHAVEAIFPDLDDIHIWFYNVTGYPFD